SRVVDRAIARIENRPILVRESISLHILYECDTEHGGIVLLTFAFRAAQFRWVFSGFRKYLDDLPLIDSPALGDSKPRFGPTGRIHLFPETGSGRLLFPRCDRRDRCCSPHCKPDAAN